MQNDLLQGAGGVVWKKTEEFWWERMLQNIFQHFFFFIFILLQWIPLIRDWFTVSWL